MLNESSGNWSGMPGPSQQQSVIRECEQYLKSFNPVTHSIDTHLIECLNTDVSRSGAKSVDVLKAQIVTGVLREKKVLDGFIRNFYGDNGAFIARADMTMFTILAYLAIFRLRELGFGKFKELAKSEDPSKISTFVNYLFSREVLQNQLRSDWMKVSDLTFVEKEIIGTIENFIGQAEKYNGELNKAAAAAAEAEAEKEAAKANGTAGVGATTKKAVTRPVSPKLSRPRPPRLPEPERIASKVEGLGDIDLARLNRTTLEKIDKVAKERSTAIHEQTRLKYVGPEAEAVLFKFNETKGGRPLEDVRREIEAAKTAELQFNNTYVHQPPDFSKTSAKIRLNAAAILKEDFLYRKQQAKDAAILKNYEEELRDPIEYFSWQTEMRKRDHTSKIEGVAARREQAKQGAIEAAIAIENQLKDNQTVAALMREQAEVIVRKKELEREIEQIEKRQGALKIAAVRDVAPALAVEKVIKERIAVGAKTREELAALIAAKEEEDRQEELIRADKIRQLRAVNTVHRAHITVFDPTKTAGLPLLSEMSYMEMKERLAAEKARAEVVELNKRSDIIEAKLKKARDLEHRTLTVLRAREVKKEANKEYYAARREKEATEKVEVEKKREVAAVKLEEELREMREAKRAEVVRLKAEQDRVARQQAYLGAASGAVEENSAKELLMAKERQISQLQSRAKYEAVKSEEARLLDYENKISVRRIAKAEKFAREREREAIVAEESKDAVRKIKAEIARKKGLAALSRAQHEVTAKVKADFNPYAMQITAEGLEKSKAYARKLQTTRALMHTAVSR